MISPEVKTVQLQYSFSATATGAGVIDGIATYANSAAVRTYGADFADWAALYREYRVRSLRLEFHPNAINAVAANPILFTPCYTVVDRLDASSVASAGNIVSNTSLNIVALDVKWMRATRAQSTGEANFVQTSADSASFFTIKVFATGLTNAGVYGVFLVRWVTEFRTRD